MAARAGAKFQPKAKRKAKGEASGSMASKLPDVMKEEAATSASAGLDAVQVVQPENVVDDSRSSQVINPSQVAVSDSLLAEVAVSNCCDDTNSNFGKSVGEVKEKKFYISFIILVNSVPFLLKFWGTDEILTYWFHLKGKGKIVT